MVDWPKEKDILCVHWYQPLRQQLLRQLYVYVYVCVCVRACERAR